MAGAGSTITDNIANMVSGAKEKIAENDTTKQVKDHLTQIITDNTYETTRNEIIKHACAYITKNNMFFPEELLQEQHTFITDNVDKLIKPLLFEKMPPHPPLKGGGSEYQTIIDTIPIKIIDKLDIKDSVYDTEIKALVVAIYNGVYHNITTPQFIECLEPLNKKYLENVESIKTSKNTILHNVCINTLNTLSAILNDTILVDTDLILGSFFSIIKDLIETSSTEDILNKNDKEIKKITDGLDTKYSANKSYIDGIADIDKYKTDTFTAINKITNPSIPTITTPTSTISPAALPKCTKGGARKSYRYNKRRKTRLTRRKKI